MREFDELVKIMETLRAPGGCVWDREQTHETLMPFIIEESHETIDALDSGDRGWAVEELGDLLLQVIFNCQVAKEAGEYSIQDVLKELNEKLIRRHPHVFRDMTIETSEELEKVWEEIKKKEKEAKRQRREVRSMSPMFKKNIAHVLLKKKRFFEEKGEINADLISEKDIPISDSADPETRAGDLILKGLLLAFSEGIEPERALWNAVKRTKER